MKKCMSCASSLTADEIAIYKRLIDRSATDCQCKSCLAKRLKVDVSEIDKKIDFFKRHGCTLFT